MTKKEDISTIPSNSPYYLTYKKDRRREETEDIITIDNKDLPQFTRVNGALTLMECCKF